MNKNSLVATYSFNLITQLGAAALSFIIVWLIKIFSGDITLAYVVSIVAATQSTLLFVNWSLVSVNRLGLEEFIKTKKISKIFSARTLLLLICLLLISLAFPLWAPFITQLLKISYPASYFVLIYFITSSLTMHLLAGFSAVKRLKMPVLLFFIEKALILLFVFCIYLFSTLSWQNIMVSYIAASGCIIIIALAKLPGYYNFNIDWKVVKMIIVFSLPIIPYTITAFFTSNYLDTFFISNYLEKPDLVIYSISYQVYGLWVQLPTILNSLILPTFVGLVINKDDAKIKNYVNNYLHVIILLWTLASLGLAYFLSLILPGIFKISDPQFKTIVTLFIISSSVSLANYIAYSPLLLAKKIISFSFPLALVTAFFNVLGNIYLIPLFGLKGCAYATAISGFMGFLTLTIFFHFKFRIFSDKTLICVTPAIICIIATVFIPADFAYYLISGFAVMLVLLYYWKNVGSLIKLIKSQSVNSI